jgi:hypothetical protein
MTPSLSIKKSGKELYTAIGGLDFGCQMTDRNFTLLLFEISCAVGICVVEVQNEWRLGDNQSRAPNFPEGHQMGCDLHTRWR